MRLKAIPEDAIEFVKHNPYYVVGGLILAGGAYYYMSKVRNTTTGAVTQDDNASTGSLYDALGYSSPIVYSNGTTSTSTTDSSSSGAVSSSQVGIDATTAAILAEKSKTDDYAHIEAMFSLSNQLTLGAANDIVAMAGIQSANYQIGAGLAEAFIQNQTKFISGSITGPDGSSFGINLAQLSSKDSGKSLKDFLSSGAANSLAQLQGTYNDNGIPSTSYASLLASTLGIAGSGGGNSASVAPSSSSVGQSTVGNTQSGGVARSVGVSGARGITRVVAQ